MASRSHKSRLIASQLWVIGYLSPGLRPANQLGGAARAGEGMFPRYRGFTVPPECKQSIKNK